MGTKLNTVLRLRNGKIKYNSYVYDPSKDNMFSPDELAEMQDADAQIEQEEALTKAAQRDFITPGKNQMLSMLTPEQRKARRVQMEKDRYMRNRDEILRKQRERVRANSGKYHERDKLRYQKNRDQRLQRRRELYALKKAEKFKSAGANQKEADHD